MDKEAKVKEWFLSKFSCLGYGFPLHYRGPNYMPKDIAEDFIKEVLPKIDIAEDFIKEVLPKI